MGRETRTTSKIHFIVGEASLLDSQKKLFGKAIYPFAELQADCLSGWEQAPTLRSKSIPS